MSFRAFVMSPIQYGRNLGIRAENSGEERPGRPVW